MLITRLTFAVFRTEEYGKLHLPLRYPLLETKLWATRYMPAARYLPTCLTRATKTMMKHNIAIAPAIRIDQICSEGLPLIQARSGLEIGPQFLAAAFNAQS
jgi:hypothetical protein